MTIELSREQFRTMILYDWKIGLNYRETHVSLVVAWVDQGPSDRTVLNWFHEYERGNWISLIYLVLDKLALQ